MVGGKRIMILEMTPQIQLFETNPDNLSLIPELTNWEEIADPCRSSSDFQIQTVAYMNIHTCTHTYTGINRETQSCTPIDSNAQRHARTHTHTHKQSFALTVNKLRNTGERQLMQNVPQNHFSCSLLLLIGVLLKGVHIFKQIQK